MPSCGDLRQHAMAVGLLSKHYVPEVFTGSVLALEAPQSLPEVPGERPITFGARTLLVLVVAVGAAVLANEIVFWHSPDLIKFGAFLAVSVLSAGARVRVPGVTVPLPLSYFFVLL